MIPKELYHANVIHSEIRVDARHNATIGVRSGIIGSNPWKSPSSGSMQDDRESYSLGAAGDGSTDR